MLFNIISHWPDILKAIAAIVVFVSGTAFALNVLFTLLGVTAKLVGLDKVAAAMTKAAGAVSWFGAEVHVLAIRWGILPADQKKPDAPAGGATASGSVFADLGDEPVIPVARSLKRACASLVAIVVVVMTAGLVASQIEGCSSCPTAQPPQGAQASAIVLRVDDAVSASEAAMTGKGLTAASSPKLAERVAAVRVHLLKIKSGEVSFWCSAKNLYDELVALEGEVVAAGLPIPSQLTEALQLTQWAVDRIGCSCPAGGA